MKNTQQDFKALEVENENVLEAYGFSFDEIPEEPRDEIMYRESTIMKPETKEEIDLASIFELKVPDVEEEIEEETVEFNETEEAMITLLKEKSRELSKYCFYIEKEDADGIPYGNFNGAGDRAITMYQPDSPKSANNGRNYGKMFYQWKKTITKDVLYAIFEQAQVNPLMNKILFGKKEEAVEEE